ncbi:arginine--tRNA ligase [Candidatus Woesearchaeota archaeon]|nr:arginine--tRNA ligase [Candidatus Woesearchaeota archaeon]
MDFKEEIVELLAQETKLKREELMNLISVPPNSTMGDYAFPCFKLGKNPKEEGEKLKSKLILPNAFSKVEVAGAYLNFYLNHHYLAEQTLKTIYRERKYYGKEDLGKGKRIVIDFSSPNIAKPFGIGHLRSTVIGNCLYKLHIFLGYKAIGVNHLGDWGTQFGKLIVAYTKWGNETELQQDPIKYLLKLYVRFHDEAERDASLNDLARDEFKKLEDGQKEALRLWELFRELSLAEFKKIYRLLDVEFDSYTGEAFYSNVLGKTIEEVSSRVSTEVSDGALIVNLEKYNMAPVLLRKSNGTTSYHTRDLAAIFYRIQKYKANKLIYVVGQEQKLHFQQLFKVMELMKYDSEMFKHVDFGLFKFPEGKMSTRKGNVIFLEEVLDKAIELVRKLIEEKNPDLKNKEEVARQVGVGAIIFADLSNDRIRDINFDWDRMLSFEGETGPYLQYTHARACSILRKAESERKIGSSEKVNYDHFQLEEELKVIRQLDKFNHVLKDVLKTYKPHTLARYLLDLAQAFNEFYHQCPVLSDQMQATKARLLLVDCVRQVLANGLDLMGIKAPEEM